MSGGGFGGAAPVVSNGPTSFDLLGSPPPQTAHPGNPFGGGNDDGFGGNPFGGPSSTSNGAPGVVLTDKKHEKKPEPSNDIDLDLFG